MRAGGSPWPEVFAALPDQAPNALRFALDPAFADKRRQQQRQRRRAGKTGRAGKRSVEIDATATSLRSLILHDARDLTARLCGDPLPGRSALDRRGRQETPS
jgi:hypothetical protein